MQNIDDIDNGFTPVYPQLSARLESRRRSVVKTLLADPTSWPAQLLHEPMVQVRCTDNTLVWLADPVLAGRILSDHSDNFVQPAFHRRVVSTNTGQHNISVANSTERQHQKRDLSQFLGNDGLIQALPIVIETTNRVCREGGATGSFVIPDILDFSIAITFQIIWQLMFADRNQTAIPDFVRKGTGSIYRAQIERNMGAIAQQINGIIDQSMGNRPKRPWIESNPFGIHSSWSEAELIDNGRFLLGSGHQTSALAITWILWLLGQTPSTQQRIFTELDGLGDSADNAFLTGEGLSYLDAVINESMRLFPPAVVLARSSASPLSIDGHHYPKETTFAVNLYALHRHRTLWNEPDRFYPERFLADSNEPKHAFAFIPFSLGRHACIGQQLAKVEMRVILATLLKSHRVTTCDTRVGSRTLLISLQPDRPVELRFEKR